MYQNQDKAFKEYIKELWSKGLKVRVLKDYNKGRHRLIQVEDKKYYMIYKRRFFESFGYKFPEYAGQQGESINEESLNKAIDLNVDKIIFLHPDRAYETFPLLIKNYCTKNNLRRITDKRNVYKGFNGYNEVKKEMTYSFPVSLFEK